MDLVFIRGLQVSTTIGVYSWEKSIKQTLSLDIQMETDIRAAADSDVLAKTIDYAEVSERVTHFVQDTRFELVESVAERVASLILNDFDVSAVDITLEKPGAVRNADSVGVRIKRTK